jgi:hypothetical protein
MYDCLPSNPMHTYSAAAMKPFIQLAFPSGHVFEVPSSVVADDRTAYYAVSQPERTREQHAAETASLFTSEFEVVDWLMFNMNWADLEPHAKLIDYRAPDLRAAFDDAVATFESAPAMPDVVSKGVASTVVPIGLAMNQAVASGKGALMLAFQNEDTKRVQFAFLALCGHPDIVEGYIAVCNQFSQHLDSQAQATTTH